MPTTSLSPFTAGAFALCLTFSCAVGCDGGTENVQPNLDENDPRLIESDEVINFVPETMSKEDAEFYK
ncbi:hypothetical protein [Rhodopirellula sallentina]|uniref:hypothetical protein n=1 Tax=Rhodopirellula sallentina TaxID=1263869 RepID=UPI00034C36D8|nr:hypothetical protein [Rhodopirellula sallentina]